MRILNAWTPANKRAGRQGPTLSLRNMSSFSLRPHDPEESYSAPAHDLSDVHLQNQSHMHGVPLERGWWLMTRWPPFLSGFLDVARTAGSFRQIRAIENDLSNRPIMLIVLIVNLVGDIDFSKSELCGHSRDRSVENPAANSASIR